MAKSQEVWTKRTNYNLLYVEHDVLHAFGVLRINAFGIDTQMGGHGRGLFPLLALMSHSCQSNLQHEQSKSTSAMVLTAQRTIEEGEELTIRYIDTIQGNSRSPNSFLSHCCMI